MSYEEEMDGGTMIDLLDKELDGRYKNFSLFLHKVGALFMTVCTNKRCYFGIYNYHTLPIKERLYMKHWKHCRTEELKCSHLTTLVREVNVSSCYSIQKG